MVVVSQRRRPINGSFVDVVEVVKSSFTERNRCQGHRNVHKADSAPETNTSSRTLLYTHEWSAYPSDTVKPCQPSQFVVKGIGVDLTHCFSNLVGW